MRTEFHKPKGATILSAFSPRVRRQFARVARSGFVPEAAVTIDEPLVNGKKRSLMEAPCHLGSAGIPIRLSLPQPRREPIDVSQAAVQLSFETVYEQYFEYVWSLVRRFGVPSEAIADIVQDVFLVVYRKLDSVELALALPSWLYSIVRRVASGHHRKVRNRKHSTADIEEIADAANGSSPADLAERSEKARQLWQLLDSLDAEKREVFVMAELGEMSCPEIAEVLGIPPNTAYSRLRRAREAFEAAFVRHRARTKEQF